MAREASQRDIVVMKPRKPPLHVSHFGPLASTPWIAPPRHGRPSAATSEQSPMSRQSSKEISRRVASLRRAVLGGCCVPFLGLRSCALGLYVSTLFACGVHRYVRHLPSSSVMARIKTPNNSGSTARDGQSSFPVPELTVRSLVYLMLAVAVRTACPSFTRST
jgi:hypothetical protein